MHSIKHNVSHEDANFFQMRFHMDESGKVHGNVSFPHTYVKVKSKEDLEELLEYFSHHLNWTKLVPNKTFARRTYVEKTRPALRYYCEKYGVEVPEWLANDKMFVDMAPSKKQELFGTQEINITEFRKLNNPPFKTELHQQQPAQRTPKKPSKPSPKAKK